MSEQPAERASLGNGRYQVIGALGEGTQGETLEAIDKREGRLVAVKRFRIRGARNWKSIELAEREARVLARLRHPALPHYLDHFEEEGALHLVMNKVEGENLAQRLRAGQRFDQHDVVRLLRAAADVLDYLHTQAPPVIHRDLKPGNVVLRPDHSFAFVDFGCVRDSLKPEGGSTVVGTFGYMAPEQFQGRALPASDVYAIGATALAMLTGREPEQLPHRGLAIDVKQTLRGVAAPGLVRVLEQMLKPDPDERASRLTPLLAYLPTTANPSLRAREAEPQTPHWQTSNEAEPRRTRRRTRGRARRRQATRETAPENEELGQTVQREVRHAWRMFQQEMFGADGPHRSPAADAPGHRGRKTFHHHHGSLPLAFAAAGIAIARLVTWAVFAVAIPVILSVLAVLAGRPLGRASTRAARLGNLVDDRLRQAHDRVKSTAAGAGPRPRVRVDNAPPRVRLDPDEEDYLDDPREDPTERAKRRPSVQRRSL